MIGWCQRWLRNPQNTDEPWEFTPEQARFVLWWYAIDENGRWQYQRGVLQRIKGWGKDPLLAALSLVEWVGPCRFGGWDDQGYPIAKPLFSSLVQIAAVASDQTTNTSDMFRIIASPEFMQQYKVEFGVEISRANGGLAQIVNVTSNPAKLEGKRPTFCLLNETQEWVTTNKGTKMYSTLEGNVAKGYEYGTRMLCICNAYVPGRESVAEVIRRQYDDIQAKKAADYGLLYDSIEAEAETPLTREGISSVWPMLRGDSLWCNVEGAIVSSLNKANAPSESRRKWLNQIVAREDALVTATEFDSMEDQSLSPLREGDKIVLGFDGGKTGAATALVAIRLSDNLIQPLMVEQQPWDWDEKEEGQWSVDQEMVSDFIAAVFRRYDVQGFYADVNEWSSYVADWSARYGEKLKVKAPGKFAVGWDMRREKVSTDAHELLLANIRRGIFKHRGELDPLIPVLRRHALAATRWDNGHGVYFKPPSRSALDHVDAYAAWLLANQAHNDYFQNPPPPPRRRRSW